MSHISKQQATDRLGISLECNWEQARTAYNLKVVHIYSAYPHPRTKEDEDMRADEIRPFYEALRFLFPIELSKDPVLQQMTAAVPPLAPTPPPPFLTIQKWFIDVPANWLIHHSGKIVGALLVVLFISTLVFSLELKKNDYDSPERNIEELPQKPDPKPEAPHTSFYVIVGTFSNPQNANNRVEALRRAGYSAVFLSEFTPNLISVCTHRFDLRSEAESVAIALKRDGFEVYIRDVEH